METDKIKKIALMQAVESLIDKSLKIPNGFPIPLRNQLFLKKMESQKNQLITEAGLMVIEGANTVRAAEGLVYAVGPEVSDFVIPGIRVMYDGSFQFPEITIKGIPYIRMYEHEVLCIIPHDAYVYQGVYSEKYLRRYNKIKMWNDFNPKNELRYENQADKEAELAKKKNKKI